MSLHDIHEREQSRCRAMVACDIAALERLFSDDMLHVHLNGLIDDKASYLADTQSKYRYHDMQRLTYRLRDHGNVVLATGELSLDMTILADSSRHSARLITSQVWIQSPGGWQQANYHASRIG